MICMIIIWQRFIDWFLSYKIPRKCKVIKTSVHLKCTAVVSRRLYDYQNGRLINECRIQIRRNNESLFSWNTNLEADVKCTLMGWTVLLVRIHHGVTHLTRRNPNYCHLYFPLNWTLLINYNNTHTDQFSLLGLDINCPIRDLTGH